jgi:hypothetical protein
VPELGIAVFALACRALRADTAYVRRRREEVTPALNAPRRDGPLILFVPTFLMGGTLPVLTRGLVQHFGDFGTRLSWLYGVNTLGAVLGALGAGFLLIPALGVWHAARRGRRGGWLAALAAGRCAARGTHKRGAAAQPASDSPPALPRALSWPTTAPRWGSTRSRWRCGRAIRWPSARRPTTR